MHAFNSVYDKTHDDGRSMAAGHAAAQQCEGTKAMDEFNSKPIRFNIYTRSFDPETDSFLPSMLIADLGIDGKMRLHGTASSTIKDYHGDEIMETGLSDMEIAANNNLTIFGNHSYEVPEDVYGSVEAARLARAAAYTKSGDAVHDLKMAIVVNDENERAVKTWKAIKKGTKLGLSIGAMIPEGGARRDPKSGALKIEHLELLETSIVGIPANPRSWVDSAVKSFTESESKLYQSVTWNDSAGTVSNNLDWHVMPFTTIVGETEPEIVKKPFEGHERHDLPDSAFACPEKRLYPHHTASGAVDKPHLRAALSRVGDPKNDQCGKAHLEAHAKQLGMGDRDQKDLDPTEYLTTEFDEAHFKLAFEDWEVVDETGEADPEITDATCPDCGGSAAHPKGDCSNPMHKHGEPDADDKAVEPDVEKVRVRVTVDTEEKDKTPAAPQSEPETPEADPTNSASETVAHAEEVIVGLDAEVTAAFTSLTGLVNQLTDQLVIAKRAERDALTAKAQAEGERDAIVAQAGDLIAKTKAVLEKLAGISLGPRAAIDRDTAKADLSNLEGVYSREFLDLLRS